MAFSHHTKRRRGFFFLQHCGLLHTRGYRPYSNTQTVPHLCRFVPTTLGMGLFTSSKASCRSDPKYSQLPSPTSSSVGDECHVLNDLELERRYNILRAEEHARTGGKCGPEWSRKVGLESNNKDRNRYSNIIPWDHSRVKLPVKEGGNDYINASWIQLGAHTYIASQGPLASTSAHFWQMVYAYGGDPATVVMLTPVYEHVVEKCARYWPSDKHADSTYTKEQGDFEFGLHLTLEKKSENEHYTYSQFKLTPDDPKHPPHTIHHLYYNTWLDYSKPNADADIRALIQLVNNSLKNPGAPLVVHCSAGIGRTGTFIAIDALLSKVDTDIRLPNFPTISPVWKEDISDITDKTTPFAGEADQHSSTAPIEAGHLNPLSIIAQRSPSFSAPLASSEPDTSDASSKRRRSSVLYDSVRPSDLPLNVLEEASTEENTPAPESAIVDDDEPVASRLFDFNSKDIKAIPTITVSTLSTALKASKNLVNCRQNGSMSNGSDTSESNSTTSTDATSLSTAASSVGGSAKTGPVLAGSAKTGPVLSGSAKSGPLLVNRPSQVVLTDEFFAEKPNDIDVVNWFDQEDPVMAAVRCMRKQRPKMVQGKQQLGYIYDQLEIAQQLSKVHSLSRRDTFAGHELSSSGMSIRSTEGTIVGSLNRSETTLSKSKSRTSTGSAPGRKLFRRPAISSMFSPSSPMTASKRPTKS